MLNLKGGEGQFDKEIWEILDQNELNRILYMGLFRCVADIWYPEALASVGVSIQSMTGNNLSVISLHSINY